MITKIEHVLEQYVRPRLREHYGDVEVLNFQEGVLEINFG